MTGSVTNQNEGAVSVIDIVNLKETMKIPVGKSPTESLCDFNRLFDE